jgi:hypothetical protein
VRDQLAKQVANRAYHAAMRPARAKIVQVPAVSSTPEKQTMRSIVIPHPGKPITRAASRLIGEAYVRVLESLPPETAAKLKELNIKRAEIRKLTKGRPKVKPYKRAAKGEWWMSKFADVVERRKDSKTPAFRTRKNRRRKKPAKVAP